MSIPKREIPPDLMQVLMEIKPDTTLDVVVAIFLICVLKRHGGNRTATCKELRMPIRTLRNRIWQIESMGFDVPVPMTTTGGYTTYLKKISEREFKKTRKKFEL